MKTYKIEIGRNNKLEVRHIVKILSTALKIKKYTIGKIKLFHTYSTIELPKKISEILLRKINYIKIFNKKINIKPCINKKNHSHFLRKDNHLNRIYSLKNRKNFFNSS